ncbi:uncharacterized protein LOC120260100 [Dioscorea cayenensis subsp. rotundata]|uniref:Uncharacterized protein LOC120260100 n=1 Tax=Dioscorea cayennensis subsp. rotundata TaxID=55577 RepID=A0AB40B863_DIOCR|nr:uncharacterized protein LOC120260100 [Dioscorea cayenensis subsp. rotundata]
MAAVIVQFQSVALITSGYSYIGAKANINVWNPRVEADDEYTTGQMWLRNGPYNNSDSIELGWMVNPSVYGDRRTRLFTYWTVDSGKTLGCFDLLCPGFVQLSNEITLGAPIEPVSTSMGPQYQIPVEVIKVIFIIKSIFICSKIQNHSQDNKNEAWWFIYAYNITVGYWPAEIFRGMSRIATLVEWGGDVYTPRLRSGGPHTATAMGSGAFANEHWGYSSFIQKPRIMDYSSTYKYPQPYGAYTPAINCYSGENYARKLFTEPLFYFGGPGRNMYCP